MCAVQAMQLAGWTGVVLVTPEEMTGLIVEGGKAILECAAYAATGADDEAREERSKSRT